MMASQFPDSVEMSDVLDLVALLRSGTAQPATVVKESLWIFGCAVNQFDGEEPAAMLVAGGAEQTDEDFAAQLEEVVEESKTVSASSANVGAPNWLQMLYPIVWEMAQKYFAKWLSK